MSAFVTDLTTGVNGFCYQVGKRPTGSLAAKIAAMATRKRPTQKQLFISEWFVKLGVKDAQVAKIVGVERETVFRWRKEQWRLDPGKIGQLADALGIKPQQFWHPPGRESIDAMLDDSDDATRQVAADVVRRLVQK